MAHPKLASPSSGLGGRGYRRIFDDGSLVPSITTALGAIEKPGIVDWHVSQTAAFAVANVDQLLNRTEEQGMRFMQYFSRRLTPAKVDELDVYDYSAGVLSDLAEVGDFIHDWIEADLNGWFPADPWRDDQEQMVGAWLEWRDEHDVEVVCTERTVFGDGYAGTFDLIAKIDGVLTLIDVKSSRQVYDSHIAQLAAIGACTDMATEVSEGTPGAVYHKITPSIGKHHGGQVDSWWQSDPLPVFEQYAILQVRPDDYDNDGVFVPAFAELHVIPQEQIDAGFDLFKGGLAVRHAQRRMKEVLK